jgi:hypothetical protein
VSGRASELIALEKRAGGDRISTQKVADLADDRRKIASKLAIW